MSSCWLAALCIKRLRCNLGPGCGLKLGRQAAWRPGISVGGVTFCGGTVQAVAEFKGDCVALGLGLWAQTRSSSCLAAGSFRIGVVRFGGGLCKQLLCLKVTVLHLGSGCGLRLGRQAAWRPGVFRMVSSRLVAALCKQLPCLEVTAWFLGSGCGL